MSTTDNTEKPNGGVKLRVSDSQYRDVGKGLARIGHSIMKKMGLSAGDIVEIVGKQRTAAKVLS